MPLMINAMLLLARFLQLVPTFSRAFGSLWELQDIIVKRKKFALAEGTTLKKRKMEISNRKIIIAICILIPFTFLSCIRMRHKGLCKGFINEKSFVLGASTIKDIQKRFNAYKDLEIFPNNDSLYITKIEEKEGFIKILSQKRFLFKDSLLQKVELVVSTSCCWNNDFKEDDFAQHKDEIFSAYNKYIYTIKSENSASKCFHFQSIDTTLFHKTTLFKWEESDLQRSQ